MPPLVYMVQRAVEKRGKSLKWSDCSPQEVMGQRDEFVADGSLPAVGPIGSYDGCVSVEFGTVLVYTCVESCWKEAEISGCGSNGWREEYVFVQADPDDMHFFTTSDTV